MTDNSPGHDDTGQRGDRTRFSPTRRDFVKAAGAVGLAGGVSTATTGTAVAQEKPNTVPFLSREEGTNLITDPQGNEVVLRGVNIPDPLRAARDAPDYKLFPWTYVEKATDAGNGWHSDVVRIPLQPNDIAREGAGSVEPLAYTEEQLLSYLDTYVEPTIQTAKERGAYIILDYHRHWPSGPRWDNEDLSEELHRFWEIVAPRYAGDPHVIFELFNEPTEPYAGYEIYQGGPDVTDPEGEETWLNWREQAQPWVDTVREHADNLLIIGNPRWSQWTYWAPEHEFEGENLAYCGHFYTQEGLRPLSTYFGEPSEEVPVFITEFGFGGSEPHMNGGADEHVPEFTEFFEEYDRAHWMGWCFDFDWTPSMLDRSDYTVKNEWGQWNKDHLERWKDDAQPAGVGGDRDADDDGVASSDWWIDLLAEDAVTLTWDDLGADTVRAYLEGEQVGETTGEEIQIGGLDAGTLYEIGISTVDGSGDESDVSTMYIITKEDGPGGVGYWDDDGEPDAPVSPSDAWTNDVGETAIEMGWASVANADAYNVYLDDVLEESTSSTSYTIDGLEPDTDYEIGIAAENDVGESPMETTTVTTGDGNTGGDCEDAAETETLDNGDLVCDVDGDGSYRDVNGDGAVSNGDVTDFFSNQHVDPWDSRTDLFDFDGNEEVGQGDVIELFRYVN